MIDEVAFSGCSGLTSLTIPGSVSSIETGAFEACSGLESIKVADDNRNYDSRENCNAIIEKTGQNWPGDRLLLGCKNTTIPGNVIWIGQFAFSGCTGLEGIGAV